MKKIAFVLITVTLFLIFIASCELPVSIESRIDMFIGELNTDNRSETYKNFHPNTADRDAMKDPDFFESGSLAIANQNFSFSGGSPYDIGGGQQEVDGTFTSVDGSNTFDCYFIMEQDGVNWLIREFDLSGTGAYNISRK